jgi:hypothetical protein
MLLENLHAGALSHDLETRSAVARRRRPARAAPPRPLSATSTSQATAAARLLNGGCALLSLAVLGDSGLEHYRGMFFNKAMYTPLAVSALSLAASLHGARDRSAAAEHRRHAIYTIGAATGLAGTAFHLYNVGKREGGYSFENLFYGAPVGAPVALLLAGILGVAAERVRDTAPGRPPLLFSIPAGRVLAGITALGLLGTVGEVALLHFRGAFHNPAMYLPVTVPPVAAGLMAGAALGRSRRRPFTRLWLRLTTALGLAGTAFHAYGVQRGMGGWRNWSQNILNGPPIPAPPAFTGLGLAALAALRVLENRRHG